MDAWTGGRAVVELLKVEGVKHVFGIVGSTFLDVLDRLYDDSSVEYINVRHEQAAAFMADGLARVTDRPGVCLVTSGPGATNLMTGVAAAYVAHSPVVVLVGGIALDHYQKDAFQEYDLLSMFRPVTKHAVLINKPERIPELLRGALRAAMSGRPGPVFVEIPRDVLGGKLPPVSALAPESYRVTHPQPPHAAAVREAVQRLRRAERPLLLVGGGATRAGANDAGHAAERAVRHPDDHGVRPERRRAQRASALSRPPRARRRPGGRGRVPAGRSHPRGGVAAGPVHEPVRRSLRAAGHGDHPDRHRRPGHRPLLPGGGRHPGRRARDRSGAAGRARPGRRARGARRVAAGGRGATSAATGPARRGSRPRDEAHEAAARLRRAAARPAARDDRGARRRRRARVRVRPSAVHATPHVPHARSTWAGWASRFRWRSAPSSAGRRLR